MTSLTSGLTTVTLSSDPANDDIGTSPADMVVVDTAYGRVEVTLCNGGLVAEVFRPISGTAVGLLHTSLAEGQTEHGKAVEYLRGVLSGAVTVASI